MFLKLIEIYQLCAVFIFLFVCLKLSWQKLRQNRVVFLGHKKALCTRSMELKRCYIALVLFGV